MASERNIKEFNKDVEKLGGYAYTGKKLSCRMANSRISDAVFELTQIKGKTIIDIGCGDGTYTMELLGAGAKEILGVDASETAIEIAAKRVNEIDNISFKTCDIYHLATKIKYDIAIVRGILHHLYDVESAIDNICKLADTIIVVEPNGYNPVLKVLEQISSYHRVHEEKSYRPDRLDTWFRRRGCSIEQYKYIGLVPMFCYDTLARILKSIEPIVERLPLIKNIACGQYIIKVGFKKSS